MKNCSQKISLSHVMRPMEKTCIVLTLVSILSKTAFFFHIFVVVAVCRTSFLTYTHRRIRSRCTQSKTTKQKKTKKKHTTYWFIRGRLYFTYHLIFFSIYSLSFIRRTCNCYYSECSMILPFIVCAGTKTKKRKKKHFMYFNVICSANMRTHCCLLLFLVCFLAAFSITISVYTYAFLYLPFYMCGPSIFFFLATFYSLSSFFFCSFAYNFLFSAIDFDISMTFSPIYTCSFILNRP